MSILHTMSDEKNIDKKLSGSSFVDAKEVKSPYADSYHEPLTGWAKFCDGFKRREETGEREELKKTLSTRHIVMIALSTGVGTGLWVGSGKSLAAAGPAGVLIGYAIVSFMVFFVIDAAGELAVAYGNLSGGFNAYPRKFIDESLGFAIGWNYAIQWLTVFSLELVTATMTLKYWTNVNSDIFVAPFYFLILAINIFGAKGYGEAEFFFNTTKLITISGFIICAIITDLGGAGDNQFVGGRYWRDPGAFNNGFKGICSVFVSAAFAFGGTEFVSLTAAEQANPKRAIPQAIKIVGYRIIFIFMIALTMIGLLVPYNSDKLMGSGGSATHASPFVIAISSHGIRVVPHIINAVILLSVLSVANSAVYLSSRTVQSMADQGFAPQWMNYIDKTGRPLVGLIIAAICGLLSFVAAYKDEETIFNWLMSVSGLSTIFTWTGICVCHIRFRSAMKAQGRSLGELGYKTKTGVVGSFIAIALNVGILVAQFWISLFPISSKKPDAVNFFQNYLGAIVLILFYVGHKAYKKNWRLFYTADEIDLVSDRKIFDVDLLEQENAEQAAMMKDAPFVVKLQNFFC